MAANDYSLESFNRFLDYVVDKGLMKPETGKARKRAANAILGILEPEQCSDLREVDVDGLAHRFANLQGAGFKPSSLQVYQSRTRASLADFFQYVENPIAFKPSVSQRSRKATGNGEGTEKKSSKTARKRGAQRGRGEPEEKHEKHETHDKLVFPIPIRPGLIVKVSNIPADLTASEAEKIAAVVKALAVTDTG